MEQPITTEQNAQRVWQEPELKIVDVAKQTLNNPGGNVSDGFTNS